MEKSPHNLQVIAQLRMGVLRGKMEVLRSALRIEALGDRQRLNQRGFPGSVLPDKESHLLMECNPVVRQMLYHRQLCQIVFPGQLFQQAHAPDIQIPHSALSFPLVMYLYS